MVVNDHQLNDLLVWGMSARYIRCCFTVNDFFQMFYILSDIPSLALGTSRAQMFTANGFCESINLALLNPI